MQLPDWLIKATGAQQFANNPANGFVPTLGDAFQGIGHSMAEHYRNGQGPKKEHSMGGIGDILGLLGGSGKIGAMGLLGDKLGPMGLLGNALKKHNQTGAEDPAGTAPPVTQPLAPVSFQQPAGTAPGAAPPIPLSAILQLLG